MPYTAPRTWVASENVTAAQLNEQVRDNELWLAQVHGCELYKTADQTIGDSARVAVAWDAETYDTDGFHDPVTANTRITVPTGFSGYYRIMPQVSWDSNASGQRVLAIRKNSDNTSAGVQWVARMNPPAGTVSLSMVADVYLNATDYIEIVVYQTSGGNRTVNAQQTWDGTNAVSVSLVAVQFLGF